MIPNVLHFFWCAAKRNIGALEEYVMDRALAVSGCALVLHTDQAGYQRNNVTVKACEFPTHINGKLVKHVEHRVDYVRLQVMAEEGGFASDLDIVFVKPLTTLAAQPHVFAYQNKSYKTVCIGFFGCAPGSELIKRATDSYRERFPPKVYWGNASFAKLIPAVLDGSHFILPQKAIFPIRMRDPVFTDPAAQWQPRKLKDSIGCHLWQHYLTEHGTREIVLEKLKQAGVT